MGEVIGFPTRANAPAHTRTTEAGPRLAPLWREAAGEVLRTERHSQHRTLSDVAERSGVSMQYLSEVERGRKEPSSEVLAAVAGALGLGLVDLTGRVTRQLSNTARPTGPLALAA